ncbi:glutamate receptor 2-like isoform X1 [Branchiostoma floridae]|uniref:Glutamate receptor 2-like isoform X1 n=1 Tax=Branchiostoma floridae TaxID=7739 RepID=A0A9J7LFU9_BRAFL|nr:glutamate receptor 2-like isoform X1 [Branchiostoma floridae]
MAPERLMPLPRFLLLLSISTLPAVGGFPEKVIIGVIVPKGSEEEMSAFRYGLDSFNGERNTGVSIRRFFVPDRSGRPPFRMQDKSTFVDTSDSFQLVKAVCSRFGRSGDGVYAIFGMNDFASMSTMQSYCSSLQVPYITTSYPPITNTSTSFVLSIRPNIVPAVYEVIRKRYKWRMFTYLYDDAEGLASLQQMIKKAKGKKIKIKARKLGGINNTVSTLNDMNNSTGERNIIIDLDRKTTEAVLRMITLLQMLTSPWHYVIMNPDFSIMDREVLSYGKANITSFQLIDPTNGTAMDVLASWKGLDPDTYPGAGKDMMGYKAALAFDVVRVISNAFWKMKDSGKDLSLKSSPTCDSLRASNYGEQIRKFISKVNVSGLTGNIQFDDFGRRVKYAIQVMELQRPKASLTKVAEWLHRWPSGLSYKDRPPVKVNRSEGLVRVTSIMESPFLMLKTAEDLEKEKCFPDKFPERDNNCKYEGYCVDMLKKVAELVGFNFTIREVADGKYGANENGTWNGMVGELIYGKADLAVAPLTINMVREQVIEFSKPYMSVGISIMIKKPQKSKPGVFSFLDPLAYEIWMCILFAYIGVSVVLFLVSRFSPYEWHTVDSAGGGSIEEEQTNDFGIWNSLWFSLGAFMQQGCDISPRSVSGRIVGGAWWFFTLIIISSYTANLAAFLTVERMVTPIGSADDLAKQTEIAYGTVTSGSTEGFFKAATIPVYMKMWTYMSNANPSPMVSSNAEGIAKVRSSKGKYAFLLESAQNEFIEQRKPCDTMKAGSNLDSKGYGIGMPKNSSRRQDITLAVLKLREDGILQALETKWWYDKGECGPSESSSKGETSALSLSNVAGVFYILVGGLGLAMMAALLEFCYKSKVEAKKTKTSFSAAMKVKARMSIKGENGRVPSPDDPFPKSMSSVPITRPSGMPMVNTMDTMDTLESFELYKTNSQTQV